MEDVAAVIAGSKKMRWDLRARPHYEVWYTTVSQLSTGAGFWIRYAIVDPGQQGHVWGSRHAEEWTWFHCSAFVDDRGEPVPGYVTGATAQQRFAGLLLPPLGFGHLVWKEKHLQLRPETRWEKRWEGP